MPPQLSTPEESRLAQQLHFLLLFSIPIVAAFPLIIYVFKLYTAYTAAWIPAVVAVVLAVLHEVLSRGYLRFVSVSVIVTVYVSVVMGAWLHGGIRDISMIMIGLPPILASVLLGRNGTLTCGIISMLIPTALYLAELFLILPTRFPNLVGFDTYLVVLIFIVVTTGFLRITIDQLNISALQIQKQASSLQQKNHQLIQIQGSLEQQKIELSKLNQNLQAEMTERQHTEEALRQKQKLESIGLLAGGIAHDFNNLLTGILGQSSLALYHIEHGNPAEPSIKKAIASAEKAADLTNQLLAYAGRGHYRMVDVDVNQLVRDNLDLFETVMQKHAVLRLHLEEDLPPVYADRSQLQQVLMNLVINGAEAIEHEAGCIVIKTCMASVQNLDGYCLSFVDDKVAEDELYLCLEVSDNGNGMDAETTANIFDPFFTTKEVGHGLGLSALLGIVRALRGLIQVISQPENGSHFRIYFPVPKNNDGERPIPESSNQRTQQEHPHGEAHARAA